MGRKHVIERPLVLAIWPLQKRTNFIQDEVTTLEKTSFFCKKFICHFQNIFGDENCVLMHQALYVNSWPKSMSIKLFATLEHSSFQINANGRLVVFCKHGVVVLRNNI
jgi:hypothetical protein